MKYFSACNMSIIIDYENNGDLQLYRGDEAIGCPSLHYIIDEDKYRVRDRNCIDPFSIMRLHLRLNEFAHRCSKGCGCIYV